MTFKFKHYKLFKLVSCHIGRNCAQTIFFVAQVSQACISCGVNMGEYFCDVCKFYDDDVGLILFSVVMYLVWFL